MKEESPPPLQAKRQLIWRWLDTAGPWTSFDEEFSKALEYAVNQWKRAGVFDFFKASSYDYPDIQAVSGFIPESLDKFTLARSSFIRSGGHNRWTIKLNSKYRFVSVVGMSKFRLWIQKRFSNKVPMETVLLHELGHTLGLPHNEDYDSIMFPDFVSKTTTILSEKDLNSLRKLYQ